MLSSYLVTHIVTHLKRYSWELERKGPERPLVFPKPAWITSQDENIRSDGNRVLSFPLNPFFSSVSWQSSRELIERAQDGLEHQGDPSVTIWVSCSPALLPRNLKAESYHTPKSQVNFTEQLFMVSACLAWPGLHIAFVETGKQPQMSFDSWHTVFLDSMSVHTGMPCSTQDSLYASSSQ